MEKLSYDILELILVGKHTILNMWDITAFSLTCKEANVFVTENMANLERLYVTYKKPDQKHGRNINVIHEARYTDNHMFGQLHSINDLPAIVFAKNGEMYWYKYDKRHRDNDLPAIIYADGSKYWYEHDELHRDNDLPAVIYANGLKFWYQNGEQYRNNNLHVIEDADGKKFWLKNGKKYFDKHCTRIYDPCW